MAFEEQQPFDPASFEHIPVLLNECLTGLAIDPAGTYLDGTAGGAGHSRQIALRLDAAKGGRLISLDQDPDAVQTARSRLAGLPATVVQINFRYAGQALEQLGIEKINGALLDLGVSSHQLDDAARGFSYRADAPLDMRMSQQGETAADLVNTESREELARILRDYGEEPYAWQIAGKIVETRETAPILTTLQLADIVASAMPPAERRKNKNPSRRTFQALRIAVNHELDALEEGLDTIFDHLAPGGRRNARPVIAQPDFRRVFRVQQRQVQPAAAVGIFQRIAQQVLQDLLQCVGVDEGPERLLRQSQPQFQRPGGQLRLPIGRQPGQEFLQLHILRVVLFFVDFQFAEIEHIGDQPAQPLAFGQDDLQVMRLFRRRQPVAVVVQHFGVNPDAGQRRLQLMGNVGDETGLLAGQLQLAADQVNQQAAAGDDDQQQAGQLQQQQ